MLPHEARPHLDPYEADPDTIAAALALLAALTPPEGRHRADN